MTSPDSAPTDGRLRERRIASPHWGQRGAVSGSFRTSISRYPTKKGRGAPCKNTPRPEAARTCEGCEAMPALGRQPTRAAYRGTGTGQDARSAPASPASCPPPQKYVKGMNRMGASRLQHAADILGVTVPFFFESVVGGPYKPDGSAPSPAYINEFVSSEQLCCWLRRIAAATRHYRGAWR
jgi:hypothetical protein